MHSALFLVGKLIRRRTPFGSAAFPTHATATAMHFPANAGLIFLTDELTYNRYLVDTGATLSIIPCNQNSSPSGPLRLAASPTHATAMAMHFPANAGLIFLTDKLTNDRYLVDTGATLSIIPCNQNSSPYGPLLKGADGQPIPSWGFIQKTVQFQGKLFTSTFLQAAVAGPILGIDFLRKFKVIVSPELSQIQFACSAAALSAHILPSAAPPASYCLSSSTPVLAPVPIQPPAATTSSLPPVISVYLVRNPEVKSPALVLGKTSLC